MDKDKRFKSHTGLHVTDPRHLASDPPDQPARKRGRPSTYTTELAERVLAQVAEGRFLVDIGKGEGMPAYRTVWGWAQTRSNFAKAIACAHEDGAHALLAQAERLLEGATRDTIQVVREQVVHIRWRVARLNPKAYGDRSELRVSGVIEHEHKISDDAPAWIKERLNDKAPLPAPLVDVTPTTAGR